MTDDPQRVGSVAPSHVAHWKSRRLARYLGGPFEDLTGGLITFDAHDLGEAELLVEQDPFVKEGLIKARWLKAWQPD